MHDKHIARKRFGQNFLTDQGVIAQLVDCIGLQPEDEVIEIGPGLAALTAPLLAQLQRLRVIELDRDLAARLRANTQWHTRLEVIEADVLKVNFVSLTAAAPEKRLRVVGNLPYNISTPVLFHLMDFAALIQDQHFMLQKEVVQRMVAAPSTAAYGRLSVMLQWRYEMENVLHIPPQSFEPAPKVDSAFVRMVVRPAPQALDAARLSELVRVAFSQRRKLLRHTLGKWLEAQNFSGTFDCQRRAEEVSVFEYLNLAQQLALDKTTLEQNDPH